MSYYITVPLLIGFICLYSRIFAYYDKQLSQLGVKIIFYVFLLLSSLSLLVLTSQITFEYWLLGYVAMGGLSTVILLIYDYKLHRRFPDIPLWCQNFSELNYLFIILFLGIFAWILRVSSAAVINIIILVIAFMVLYLARAYSQHKMFCSEQNNLGYRVYIIIGKIFYFVTVLFEAVLLAVLSLALLMGVDDADDCITDGICKEGFIFDDCGDGKPCVIDYEYCQKHNYIWDNSQRVCYIR